jgi:deoxyribodipyrimidine photo-lyase
LLRWAGCAGRSRAGRPAEHVHEPSKAPAEVLAAAGVELGVTYPNPMVDLAAARRRAIGRYTDFSMGVE